jgi:2-oxoglutarate ferredoxin oxidoreductase subunit delta
MGRIVIDSKKCKACYLCINECPKNLLEISGELNALGQKVVQFSDPGNSCIGCAMCATRCPDLAITEVYR